MKKIIVHLVLSIMCLTALAAQSGSISVESAIMKTIAVETQGICALSMTDVVAQYWIINDKTLRVATMQDGYTFRFTGNDLIQMREVPPAGHAKVYQENFQFHIMGDSAMVAYDQVVRITASNELILSKETRLMRRVGDQWRTHMQTIVQQRTR
jgi:hypothetical protein